MIWTRVGGVGSGSRIFAYYVILAQQVPAGWEAYGNPLLHKDLRIRLPGLHDTLPVSREKK